LYGNHKKINADKFKVLYIGSDEETFYPIIDCKKSDGFTVTFIGTYIPLHVIHNILRAAKIIAEKNSDIRFTMIGEGQTFKENYRLYQDLGNTNVDFVPEFISREKLNIYYNQADLLLGIFGESYKACEVIPNKVYDALAVGRPILSMDSAAMRELFVDQETVFLVEGNSPEKIAEYILMLYKEDKLLHQVAKNGHLFFKQRFSREVLELQLEKYIAQVGL
jgi:glycosyltransferase involved in cell wall biosynthesis